MGIGIGLDVGGTKILACAVDETGRLAAETRVASPHDLTGSSRPWPRRPTPSSSSSTPISGPSWSGSASGCRASSPPTGPSTAPRTCPPSRACLPDAFFAHLQVLAAGAEWRLVLDNDATCAVAGEPRLRRGGTVRRRVAGADHCDRRPAQQAGIPANPQHRRGIVDLLESLRECGQPKLTIVAPCAAACAAAAGKRRPSSAVSAIVNTRLGASSVCIASRMC